LDFIWTVCRGLDPIVHSHRSYLHTAIKRSFFGTLFAKKKIRSKAVETYLSISANTLRKYKQDKVGTNNQEANEPSTNCRMNLRSNSQEASKYL
jgi:hypothetical protein